MPMMHNITRTEGVGSKDDRYYDCSPDIMCITMQLFKNQFIDTHEAVAMKIIG